MYAMLFPLQLYGLVAALILSFKFAPVRNIVTLGGAALFGFGLGMLFKPLFFTFNKIDKERFGFDILYFRESRVLLGIFAAEFINVLLLLAALLLDTGFSNTLNNAGFTFVAVIAQIPVMFWSFFLWDFAGKNTQQMASTKHQDLSDRGYRPQTGEREVTKEQRKAESRDDRKNE